MQSLHRNQPKEKHLKIKESKNASTEQSKAKSSETEGLLETDIKAEPFDELSPSEDEDENTEDISQPVVSVIL